MKSLKIVALFALLIAGACFPLHKALAQRGSASYQLFYDDLSPYGMWVEYPNYGYVWIPDGIPDFSPYETGGHWILTDDGWTWDSDYPWGWATFHYGRWDFDNDYGWFWVPDDQWGPAWVSWRSSPGYYGWAPLRPGISVSVSFGRDYHERNERWVFVRDGDFGRDDIGRHYVDRSNNVTIINNSTTIVNTRRDDTRHVTYAAGPDRNDVQKATHTTLTPVTIRESAQPGQHVSNGELHIYRPQMQKGNGNGHDPAPSKVARLADVKSVPRTGPGNVQQKPRPVDQPPEAQPAHPGSDNPAAKGGKEQPPRGANPQDKVQPAAQPPASSPDNKRREKQSPRVNPPDGAVAPAPRTANPSGVMARQQKQQQQQQLQQQQQQQKQQQQQQRQQQQQQKQQQQQQQQRQQQLQKQQQQQQLHGVPPQNKIPRVQQSVPKTKKDEK